MWLTFDLDGDRPEKGRPAEARPFAELVGFEPDEAQAAVLRSGRKRVILNCSRQWGKSSLGALVAVERAYREPGSLVLVAAKTARQSGELVAKAAGLLGRLGIRAPGMRLPNGSRIVGLPGKDGTIRGYSAVSMLLIDEAAQVPDSLYRTLRPMLAVSGGDLWLMSTPFGKRGFFYEAWEHGGEEWERFSVPATKCPRISAAFLEEERRALGNVWFQQEYMCRFVETGNEVFARELVEAAVEDIGVLELGE